MTAKKNTTVTKRGPVPRALAPLIAEVRSLIRSARHAAASTVNTLQVLTNFEIGRRIVEHEQMGAKRAAYGTELLKALSARLTEEFGRGFSKPNLEYMRRFYITWKGRDPTIAQKASGQFDNDSIWQKSSAKSLMIPQKAVGELIPFEIVRKPSAKSARAFALSWSHYVLLLGIKDPHERSYYEIEAASESWSIPELKRQVASCLYERLALSRNKKAVRKLADQGQIIKRPEDMLKEPYLPSKEELKRKLLEWGKHCLPLPR